ncbi:hypothetical protein ANCCEY_06364 [Ancylostoma ceylanicum]|uniref:Uncharacterized protein n=1 Tax=Ancylostoma ceylanicum TaxID=53326 RepID=A0A0D6M3R9_9BILA|nr:hypothetical protein ANCCEY_06364 [Ancylostoma ceylanicum]
MDTQCAEEEMIGVSSSVENITYLEHLHKYVYKGHDRARRWIHQYVDYQQHVICDEIKVH